MRKEIADSNYHMTTLKENRIYNFTLSIKNSSKIFDEKHCELIVK